MRCPELIPQSFLRDSFNNLIGDKSLHIRMDRHTDTQIINFNRNTIVFAENRPFERCFQIEKIYPKTL